jgi:RNA-directed DNA polymerase
MSGDVQVRFCERPGVKFPRATHLVVVFEREDDARRVAEVLTKRFEKYGLRLHPDKTRLIDFRKPGRAGEEPSAARRNASFDLLGFTHFWGKSRKGNWVVKRTTASTRFSRSLKAINDWCRRNRHLPVAEQHRALGRKLVGHDAYFGVVGNGKKLAALRHWTSSIWRKWLSRRSNKRVTWTRMREILLAFPLPPPRMRASIAGSTA